MNKLRDLPLPVFALLVALFAAATCAVVSLTGRRAEPLCPAAVDNTQRTDDGVRPAATEKKAARPRYILGKWAPGSGGFR